MLSRTHACAASIATRVLSIAKKLHDMLALTLRSLHCKLLRVGNIVGTLVPTHFPFIGKCRIEIGEELESVAIGLREEQEATMEALRGTNAEHISLLGEIEHKVMVGDKVVDLRYLPKSVEVLEL